MGDTARWITPLSAGEVGGSITSNNERSQKEAVGDFSMNIVPSPSLSLRERDVLSVFCLLLYGLLHKSSEERLWPVWPALKFRMELAAKHEWMILDFHNFCQACLWPDATKN